MKPVFFKELEFLKYYEVEIPENCWRDGVKIYLNHDDPFPIIKLKIDNKNDKITIAKNCIEKIEDNKIYIKTKYKGKKYEEVWINKTLDEEVAESSERLDKLIGKSIGYTVACMRKYKDYNWRISDSSGKDSLVCNYICQKAMKIVSKFDFDIDFFNTTNDVADTYLTIKQNIRKDVIFILENKLNRKPTEDEILNMYNDILLLWIHNPEQGFYQWIKDVKHYFTPTIGVRNCCSTYKEGKLKEILDKKQNYVLFLGMRKYESTRRQNYDWYLNEAMDKMYNKTKQNKYKLNMPRNWIRFLPIVEWEDADIWLLILREKLEYNPIYNKGFGRAGCIVCPMSSPYNDLLTKYWYKSIWNRWNGILEINYDTYNRGQALKWTKEEYILDGKWKTGESKIQGIITQKMTPIRIKQVAEILGVSENIAEKYFKNQCSCGKRLNPDEIAMYLKMFGRYENQVDDRVYLCKNCLCKELGLTKDEYALKVQEFREQGCNLF